VTASTPIAPADGRLGVLCVGLGAVTTTFLAGVELARRGLGDPIGSLTQMGTIRLGKRTEGRAPLIRDFVPLAGLDDLVFAAWDPYPDDAFVSAQKAGVLESHRHLEPIGDFLRGIEPIPAAFDPNYAKRLDGTNVKPGSKREMIESLRQDIRDFREREGCDRVVMIWSASTEIYIEPAEPHLTI
jgi:myo-inositol-1-phosphate synthase